MIHDIIVILIFICLCLAAYVFLHYSVVVSKLAISTAADGVALGGKQARARPSARASPHLIIDTLNLAHWLRSQNSRSQSSRPLSTDEITSAIDTTAAQLKRRCTGTVVYVLKDQESRLNNAAVRAAYQAAAERNRVHIACAERTDWPQLAPATDNKAHATRGRDDFYMCLQASRYRCAVATEDRLRDFSELRAEVPPFHTVTFVYWRATPERDFIRPASPAYARLRRPCTIGFGALGL
jgi:hypothetical protein